MAKPVRWSAAQVRTLKKLRAAIKQDGDSQAVQDKAAAAIRARQKREGTS